MTNEAQLASVFIVFGWVLYIVSLYFKSRSNMEREKSYPYIMNVTKSIFLIELAIWSFYPIWVSIIQFIISNESVELIQSAVGSSFLMIVSISVILGILFPFRITGRFLGLSSDIIDKRIERDLLIAMKTGELDQELVEDLLTEIWIRSNIYGNEKSSSVLARISTTDGLCEMTDMIVSKLKAAKRIKGKSNYKTNTIAYVVILSTLILVSFWITIS